jgi:hypothetical protein
MAEPGPVTALDHVGFQDADGDDGRHVEKTPPGDPGGALIV